MLNLITHILWQLISAERNRKFENKQKIYKPNLMKDKNKNLKIDLYKWDDEDSILKSYAYSGYYIIY